MPFLTKGKTNWKYILTVLILIIIVGISIYWYWWMPKRKGEIEYLSEVMDRVKNINSIKYQLTILSNEKLISKQNIWREGKGDQMKARIEVEPLAEKGKHLIEIINFSKGFWYWYTPEENEAKEIKIPEQPYKTGVEGSEDNFLEGSELIKNSNPRIIGKEVLNGKECLIVKTFSEGAEIKHWIWIEYGLPIRTISPVITLGGKVDYSRKNEFLRENIEVNIDIPDELFKLPTGVQIIPLKEEAKPKKPYIKVLSPNGGEEWVEGNTYDITWESSGVEKIAIGVTVDGKDKGHITFGVDANLGKYSWKISPGFISGFGISRADSVKIRIYDAGNNSIYDENDNYFSILAE